MKKYILAGMLVVLFKTVCFANTDLSKLAGKQIYRDLLFECFRKLDEQGYEVEIKINKKEKK